MAEKVKGISIEIGGNTTGLQKALDEVNKQTNAMQKELQQVERLLKLDPKNTELLAQKQKLLGDSIDATKTKLDALKKAKEQADKDMANGIEINQTQYRKLQREIVATEQNLKGLESQGKKTNAVLSKDDAINNLKKIGTAAAGATAALGGALVGAAVKAAQTADDINTLAKQTGLSTEEIQKFKYASELIDVPLETLTGSMAKLTRNMESARQGSNRQVEAFKELGITITDNEGKLRSNQDVFNEAIAALGKMENETQRDALAMQIFGKSAQDLNPLILGGADALKQLGDEAEAAGLILSQETLDSANALNDSIDTLKATATGVFMKIGAEIAEDLVPHITAFLEALKNLPQWIEQNKTLLELIGIAIGTVTALIIAFNIQQALLASGMTLWGAIAAGATTVTTALGAAFAFLTSPIGLIIVAIGALIAITVLIVKNWEPIKGFFIKLWEDIKKVFANIGKWFGDKFTEAKNAIIGAFAKISEVGKNIVEGLWNGISNSWDWLKNKIKEWCGNIADAIKAFFGIHSPSRLMAEYGSYLVQGLAEGITEDMSAEDAMKKKAENVSNAFKETLSKIDVFAENIRLKFQQWQNSNGDTATEVEKLDKELETNAQLMGVQLEKIKSAEAAYKKMVELYGEQHELSVQAQNDLIKEQIAMQELAKTTSELNKVKATKATSYTPQSVGITNYLAELKKANQLASYLGSAGYSKSQQQSYVNSYMASGGKNVTINQTFVTPTATPSQTKQATKDGLKAVELAGVF